MLPANLRRIVICGHVVDFRKQWNGLLGECRRLGFDPYEGDMVIFVKRDRRGLRALCGDSLGLLMFNRRFEGDCMRFLFGQQRSISRGELEMWFSGIGYTIEREVRSWRHAGLPPSGQARHDEHEVAPPPS